MASANVELVRSIFAAWERGDFSSADWAHPEIEYVHVDGPSPGSWIGRAALPEAARSWVDAWEGYRIVAEEYREVDGERVLVFTRPGGRGKASGLDIEQVGAQAAHLFHVRGGKVTRFVVYWNRERALADLGLAPEAGDTTPGQNP